MRSRPATLDLRRGNDDRGARPARQPRYDEFPRQQRRTGAFTIGDPRQVRVSTCGHRVSFLRAPPGRSESELHVLDVDTRIERAIRWPGCSYATRRSSITAYRADPGLTTAACIIGPSLVVADLVRGVGRSLAASDRVLDYEPSPTGTKIAYSTGAALHFGCDGMDTPVAEEHDASIAWGVAELVAKEELGRTRGMWWSPDGRRLVATRVDTSSMVRWHFADPSAPSNPPAELAYPAAGTPNADVSLWVLGLSGDRTEVQWDRHDLPYLIDVRWWPLGSPLTIVAQTRDQRRLVWMAVDPDTGQTTELDADEQSPWVSIRPAAFGWLGDGRLVRTGNRAGTRRLLIDGDPVTPPQLEVRSVAQVGIDGVVFLANDHVRPEELQVWRWSLAGDLQALTSEPGVHLAAAGGDTVVVLSRTMDHDGLQTTVIHKGHTIYTIASHTERPVVEPRPSFMRAGARRLPTAVLLPTGDRSRTRLPVVVNSYAGPGVQKVLRSRLAHLASQWLADCGFAVIVIDGRGTPGLGASWEHAVDGDLATPALEDQIDGLMAAAAKHRRFDLERVAFRGWSFGGYLAALAVMRHPDVFRAAVAGSPVTDWRFYDTHYSERYLGLPGEHPDRYDASSVLHIADRLRRPLLLLHGLDDRNVVPAHSLRLSSALSVAGRLHTFMPLPGVDHMPETSAAAEGIAHIELAFLRQALAIG